ncbi:TonB-dependent receptor, partial [Chitinimonas sp.]|uniref:TonB-dependent receptor n=1 Tax=Chitinimonas sp. TaxID=1934313 RepID=UPI0035B43401
MSVRTLPDLPHCGRFPYTLLALSIAAFGQHAIAAESAAASAETIVVIGQAARIQQALDVQQASDAIVSVVHADGIGALPDANVAEALQRVPGVSIERDQGEGRYVRVRGLGPDLNGVTVNGTTLPSPESGRRAVMLDTIPSALIRSLEVQKTLTPDQDASSIGGTVEIKTRSAFDAPGRFLSLETLASHDGNTGQTSPKFDLAWSDRLARGKLGMAAGLSWEKRKFGSDNIETGGAWDVSGSQALLNKFEQRDYRIERERLGAALNVEYKPEAGSRYYVRGLYTRFDDREERQSTLVSFSKPQAEGASSSAKISRALKSREEIQQVRSLNLGAEQKLGDWKLLVAGGVSHASETEPEYLTGVEFAGKSSFSGTGYRNAARPELFAPASSRDAGQFALTKAKAPMSDSHDRERNLRIDGERSTVLGDAGVAIKFGAKFSRRDKDYDKTSWAFKNLGKAPAALPKAALELGSYLNGNTGWGLGEFGPRIDEAGVRALFAGIAHDSYLDQSASQIEDYRIKEDRDAAYVQSSVEFGNWRWLGGVRFEGSRHHLQGTGLRDGVFLPTVADRRDRHWLPALQLRHDISDATSVRAAITHSVVHPTFAQMRPGLLIDVAAGEAAFGNPDLKPLTSRNLDLGIESRLGKASTVSAYVFHKRINDFIYSADLAGSGRWAGFN